MHRFICLSALLASATVPAAVVAQGYPASTANTDADRLADAVRRVGASPRDLSALIEAGELSVKVGDATAAAAFFKRAEQIDPNNGRVKAGIARILVSGEHPGEALRYFDQAERTGLSMAPYAADRGLAYDLIGQQDRAQRDYRLALARSDDDEIRRRYALSLGIAGKRDEALKEIDALLRRSDRGSWRARAFILAMNGDVPGANKIAGSMMGGGMAGGLAAFFQRLPSLTPADRAFAVHFGEVTSTPARVADAQMVPPLPALGADPTAPRPTQVAAVAPAPVQVARNDRGRSRRADRDRAAPVVTAAAPVLVGRPASGGGVVPVPAATVARAPVATTPLATAALGATAPVVRSPAATFPARPAATVASAPVQSAPVQSAPVPATATSIATAALGPSAPLVPETVRPASTIVANATPIPGVVPAVTTAAPLRSAAVTPIPTVVARATPVPAITTAAPVRTAAVTPAPAAVGPVTRPANPPVSPRGDADSILARIVANISIPASELAAASPRATKSGSLDRAARKAERNVAVQRAADKPVEVAAAKKAPTAAERRAKALADRKAKEEVAAKKLLADKAAAEKKAARADPPRYWVQVAGGANTRDLDRAWSDAQKKSTALAGRKAFTTPLRATNRVVTGPFKTEAEARAMVNTLGKQGLSAFTFASAAGQKMTRLDEK